MCNIDFFPSRAEIGGVELDEINAGELEFLFGLEFDLLVSPEEYFRVVQQLSSGYSLPRIGSLTSLESESHQSYPVKRLQRLCSERSGAVVLQRRSAGVLQ